MAFHAIRKISYSFLNVFTCNFLLIMFMTAITGVSCKAIWMAGGARDISVLTVIQRESMRPIEFRRAPGRGGMTGSAICPERARVKSWFLMTGNTGGTQSFELPICMALIARNIHVRARQRKTGFAMIECNVRPFRWRMATAAVRTELTIMRVFLFMA